MRRLLTVVGDPNQINTWSNIPYFFLKAGQKAGFLQGGLPLHPEKLRGQRLIWNFFRWVQTREIGGFQYSPFFLRRLFAQANLNQEAVEIISHFPLLPPAPWLEHWKVSYYIDATLQQVFEDYGLAAKVGYSVRRAALKQEQENYQNADRVICMCEWAAKSVVDDYGISAAKVHVIRNGANLEEDAFDSVEMFHRSPAELTPLRLGFIGKDWRRKGLLFLLQVADVLDRQGIAVEVVAAGFSPTEVPSHPLMSAVGFVNKATDLDQFVQFVQSFHFGCLFSTVDASPVSNLECLRLGIPVLATRVGGIPTTVPDGLGFLFEPDSPPDAVAQVLASFVADPQRYRRLRDRVAARASEFSWHQSVKNLMQLWQGSEEFAYHVVEKL